jgi:hypothetical protein
MPVFALVALCASHIDGLERLRCFRAMLASWSKQSFPVHLYVCMSCEPAMQAVVARVIEQSETEYPMLQFCTHEGRLAQFEHYKCLTQVFSRKDELPEDLYVIFTDDDDLWHPHRAASYLRFYEQLVQRPEGFNSGPFGLGSLLDAHKAVKAYSAADVDALVQAGVLPYNQQMFPQEYVALCVPFRILRDFISRASPELLRHRYADACFFTFARAKQPDMMLGQAAYWTYFYRFDDTRLQASQTGASDAEGAFAFLLAYCPSRKYEDALKARDQAGINLPDAVIKRLLEEPASPDVEAIKGAPL